MSTHDDWVATRFLARLRADEQGGGRRPLREYLAAHPGHEELIAREFVLATAAADELQGELDDAGVDRAAGTIGPFVPIRELGRGSQGVVHLAEDVRFRRLVALKIVHGDEPAARLQMLREAVASARVQHPGFAALLEAGEHEGRTWIATQYVEGPSLRDHLQHRGPLLPRAAAELVRQLADSLHFAHERGLVHRDVKPSNIVLGDTGPVLLDLGLAHDERGALPSIARGQVCGTPDYMAPEQIEPEQTEPGQIEPAPIDRRVDVWALGVVLLECLTGELPFAAPSRAGVLYAVLHRDPVLPAGLDRRLAAVVRTALTRDRDRRYATAAALATDLQHHLAGEPVSALLPGPLERAGQWLRRHAVVAAVVAGLLLALAVGLATALTFLARESGLRRRSELAFADVRAMARTLAFDVHDALRGVAGATAARHLVIARASELFDRLALESAGDPTLAIELVRSLTRLGDVLGHEATDNLGAVAESRAAYARAAAIAERCWQDGPASEAECDALLVAFLKVADSLARVDTTAAVAAYDRVFTRLDAADAWFPSASRRRAMRAAAELNRGSLAQAIDERDVAASYFLRASTTLRELTRDDAGRREHGDLFASTLVALGRALARLERADDGIAVLREALAVARDARFAVTGGVHSTCCLVLGTILAVGEEPQQGEALLAETIALREDLCRQNGENFSAALQLASAHFERGLLIEKTLAADLAAGLGLCERLAAERPDHPIVLLQTARLRLLAAAAAVVPARRATELAAARAAVGRLREVAPGSPDLADVHDWLVHLEAQNQ